MGSKTKIFYNSLFVLCSQTATPSPMSIQKMDGTNPEDWILSFTKEEIEKHTSGRPTAKSPSSQDRDQPEPQINVMETDMSGPGVGEQNSSLHIHCENAEGEEGRSSDEGPRSPSAEQKLFHSEFYSLCLVGSNRSLASSNCSVYQRSREHLNEAVSGGSNADNFQSRLPRPSDITEGIHSREFDEISQQIASLSRTVDELNRSLNSLNSGSSRGSQQDLQDSDDMGDAQGEEATGGAWSNSRQVSQVIST